MIGLCSYHEANILTVLRRDSLVALKQQIVKTQNHFWTQQLTALSLTSQRLK